jgi:hypothetical protein
MNEEARKTKNNKPKLNLVYKSFMEAIAKVRQFGIEKHGSAEDWRNYSNEDFLNAVLRHIFACQKDIYTLDDESKLLHLAHAACGLMFIIEHQFTEAKQPKKPKPSLNDFLSAISDYYIDYDNSFDSEGFDYE